MRGLAKKMISATPPLVGRPRINHEQTPARFAAGTLARIQAALNEGENRTDFIKLAVERELERRERIEARSDNTAQRA